jgi:DNA-binding transcriptional LysR family regulator
LIQEAPRAGEASDEVAPGWRIKLAESAHVLLAFSVADRYRWTGRATLFPTPLGGPEDGVHFTPLLLPAAHATVRRELDQWFETSRVRPSIVAEFDDSALMYAFGEEGKGVFASPMVFEAEFRRVYKVEVIGRVKTVRQRFYAIAPNRRIQHPAVIAIIEAAQREVFG